ncbi:3-hydroxybutyrate dehydrogenase [bacterium]|nr:3-hydroxybutyrate dehydrogenase [bacterium]
MRLKGKIAIVTGSTSGIGLAIAEELAREGAHLMLNGFGTAEQIDAAKKRVTAFDGKAEYHGADVTKSDEIEDMVQKTVRDLGGLDILVNNAGIQFVAPVEEFPEDKWHAILSTNLSAAFYGIKSALPHMRKQGSGRIINIASAHGLVASHGKAAYVAAKHGLVGLMKVVALEAAEDGITCNAICPGWVDTPLVRKQIEDRAKANGTSIEQETKALIGEKQPNKRFTTPAEIGRMAVYLASEDGQPITGTTLSIDGGWTAW